MSSKSESEISSNHNNKQDDIITITEKIKLKKDQYEVLKIICDTYQTSFSGYMQEALVEAMKFDIEEGNLWHFARKDRREEIKRIIILPLLLPFASDLMKSD